MCSCDDPQGRLDEIDADISRYRSLWMRAVWAGDDGQADFYRTEVDRLINDWSREYHRPTVGSA